MARSGPWGEAHTFTADELVLAEAVARLAALAIERERLQREREEARAGDLALRTANRRMEEFLSLAAHEMRTPLTTITGYLELAQRRLAPSEQAEAPPSDPERQIEDAYAVLCSAPARARLSGSPSLSRITRHKRPCLLHTQWPAAARR